MKVKEQLQKLLKQFKKMLEIYITSEQQMKKTVNDFLENFNEKIKRLTEEQTNLKSFNSPQEMKIDETMDMKAGSSNSFYSEQHQQQGSLNEKKLKSKFSIKLDFYVMELNNLSRNYKVIGIRQNNVNSSIKQITDLIKTDISAHIRNIDNQKQFLQKSANSPKILKPLVIPLIQNGKYAFVFESSQYWKRNQINEESDRFFIFICEQFLPYTYIQIAKTVFKMDYNNRVEIGTDYYEHVHSSSDLISKNSFFDNLNQYIASAETFYFSKTKNLKNQKNNQLIWYLRHVHNYKLLISCKSMQFVNINLFSLVLYFCLKDFKIIMIGTKQTRHMMSEVVIAIKTSLCPIIYNHPTIFAAISQNHNNYIDAPIPLILCLWGQQSKCNELFISQKKVIQRESPYNLPTILINLNKKTAMGKALDSNQSQSLLSVDKSINILDSDSQVIQSGKVKRKLTANIVQKTNQFIFQVLIPGENAQNKELEDRFKQTSIYKNYEMKMK